MYNPLFPKISTDAETWIINMVFDKRSHHLGCLSCVNFKNQKSFSEKVAGAEEAIKQTQSSRASTM